MANQRSKKTKKSKVVASKDTGLRRVRSILSRRPIFWGFVLVVGLIGLYVLVTTWAIPPNGLPNEHAERGLVYHGLKKDNSGICDDGEFILEQANENADHACTHIDPGPPGIDIRERAKAIDASLQSQASYDDQYQSQNPGEGTVSGAPQPEVEASITGNSLSEISGRNWTCPGTGKDGPRVKWLYVYKAGNPNRFSDVKSSLVSIAKRTNAVYYNSSQASGSKAQHIRFATKADCSLDIDVVAVTGDLSNSSNIKSQVQAQGYNQTDRKYIMSIDGGSFCGLGERWLDDSAASTNHNNSGPSYAWIAKGCWNYSEPHELSHMLGGVESSAPNATAGGHCHDQNDVMCYNDGTAGSKQENVCTSASKHWILDCNFNDYYNRGRVSGYLSTHWNSAMNQFLTQ